MKILTILDHYLPGYKAGGPIRSIGNIVSFLGKNYEFIILTRDRDIDDKSPFADARPRTWQRRGNALVRYLSPIECSVFGLWNILSCIDYDLLYINSFFSRLTIRIMLLRKIGLLRKKPLVLAPRGEFSPGALAIKAYKKRPYIKFVRLIGLYRGLVWHASTKIEADDIRNQVASLDELIKIGAAPIRVASDPFSYSGDRFNEPIRSSLEKHPGDARIVFLSRISRKKNLEYALRLLSNLSGRIRFDIFGPNEDLGYWKMCQGLIESLPGSVQATYAGEVPAEAVQSVFSKYHLFLFPTLGENFGHVIPEALSSGCLVLTSDRTPWRGLEQKGIGWDIALEDPIRFQLALELIIAMDDEEFTKRSSAAKSYIQEYFERQMQELRKAYDNVFDISKLRVS